MQVELVKHESPIGPYWYHPNHPLCDEGKVLWIYPEKCNGCNGFGGIGQPTSQTHDAEDKECPFCNGVGWIDVEYDENN